MKPFNLEQALTTIPESTMRQDNQMLTKLLACSIIASLIAGVSDWIVDCKDIELTIMLGIAIFIALFLLSLII